MRPHDSEAGQPPRCQTRHRRYASINVDRPRISTAPFNCLGDELFCQFYPFAGREDPERVVSGVDINQHVQVKPRALRRMRSRPAKGAILSGCGGDPIHRQGRAPVVPIIEFTGVDLTHRQFGMLVGVDDSEFVRRL